MSKIEWPEGTERLLEGILTDAYTEDEQLWAFRQALEDDVSLPCDAFVIGEPVEVVEINYDGNTRRGLTARCRRQDGGKHVVATGEGDLDLGAPIDLIVLAPKGQAARCRVLGTEREITLRSRDLWNMASGEIVTVHARKQWRFAGHPYLAGDVESRRLDVKALDLVPLRLQDEGLWDPDEEYWGEEGEPLEDWAKPIVVRGPRQRFEMEQVLPGADPDNWDTDPILEAAELRAAGDPIGAHKNLVEMLAVDLRCLDAHAHLGNLLFERHPEEAIRRYEVGVRIGELSLPDGFDGVLPWGLIDNRPFLRCMHGFGLCLWRLGREEEAAALFERMLWLNPSDNQGIRFLVAQIRAGEPWENDHDEES